MGRSPEQAAAIQSASRGRDLAREDAARDAGSKKAVTITLSREPEMSVLRTGERAVVFRGVEDGATKPLKAVFILPLHRVENSEQGGADLDKRLRALGGGDEMTVAGQWSKNRWEGRESWEFRTQHFAEGRHSLPGVLENARVERGERPATLERGPGLDASAVKPVRRPAPSRDGGMGGI